MVALSDLLADVNQSPIIRQAAGIQLKNCLVAKDASVKQAYNERWYALSDDIKSNVKTKVRHSRIFLFSIVKRIKGLVRYLLCAENRNET